MRTFLPVAAILVAAFSLVNAATPTAINYQGRLTDAAGDPVADGSYSVVFTIYDAATVGDSKWTETQPVTTTDGLFAVLLGTINPILDTVFNGTTRYLGISVDAGPEGSPRIKMVTVPFAFQASKSDSSLTSTTAKYADSTGAITDGGVDFADIGQNGASSGQVMKWSESGWTAAADNTGGGSGGWTDDGTVVRLDASTDSVGIGTSTPSEKLEVMGNILVDGKATIGQGHTNTGTAGFVVGESNIVTGKHASVTGGSSNSAVGVSSVVGGGFNNTATGPESVVSGGSLNNATEVLSTVAGGSLSTASGVASTVSGGVSNTASGHTSTVAGGWSNTATGDSSVVSGGNDNAASGLNATVSGGRIDTASGDYSTVGGGRINTASAYTATVSGGSVNTASGNYSTVSGRAAQRGQLCELDGRWRFR